MKLGRTLPPRSWVEPDTHFITAMASDWYRGLVQLQDAFTQATVMFWSKRRVCHGHVPVTTGSISSPMGLGSDSKPVQVDLFGVPTYLADSMQFSLEYLCRLNAEGAYYLMPSFRGEANDSTHLCQFLHSEAEIHGGLEDVLAVVEDYLRHVIGHLLSKQEDLIRAMAGDVSHLKQVLARESAFERLTFDEAVALLGDDDSRSDEFNRYRTLTRNDERRLMEQVGQFIWVTHWDHLAVPFYQGFAHNGRSALNADLLFGPGEVVGAGERHTSGDQVRAALKMHDVSEKGYEWYVDMKDLEPMATSGFGLGVERFMMWLLRHDDIRDFQLLPRENGRNIVP